MWRTYSKEKHTGRILEFFSAELKKSTKETYRQPESLNRDPTKGKITQTS